MDIFAKRQIDIAKKTLKMNDVMAKVMGGMTKEEARAILKKYNIKFNESVVDKIDKYLTESVEDRITREAKKMKTFTKERLMNYFADEIDEDEFDEIWFGLFDDGFIVKSGSKFKWED